MFSSWLVNEVRAGDIIEVLPPSGNFTLGTAAAHHVLIAAGSGITPVLSIAASALADPARASPSCTATGAAARSCSPTNSPT